MLRHYREAEALGQYGGMAPLFGRYEAAALLAVERANGGELAPLEQVIMAFDGLFGSSVTAQTMTESVTLLIDAGLVEFRRSYLGLTVAGRRLIRHSGNHWDDDFPAKVAAKLAHIDEDDLAPEGELAAPSEQDMAAAMAALGRGEMQAPAPILGNITPSGLAGLAGNSARLFAGMSVVTEPNNPLQSTQAAKEAATPEADAPPPPIVPSAEDEA